MLPIAEKYDSLQANSGQIDDEICRSFENAASNLWNCTAIAIKAEKDHEKGRILCGCKLFATVLLSIYDELCPSMNKKLRVLRCHLIVFKLTLDRDWDQLCRKVLGLLERIVEAHESSIASFEESEFKNFQRSKLEYLLLRFQSSVKLGDFETARIYSSQADIASKYDLLDANTLLELCRIIYNATLALNTSQEPTSAQNVISLLRDVQMYLQLPVADLKSQSEFNSLKFMSLLLLANCLIESDKTTWDLSECQKYVSILQETYPKKVEPFILGIKLLKKNEESVDEEAIFDTIMKMIMSIEITSNFDAVVSSINEFAVMNIKKALRCLDYIFLNKMDPGKDQNWLEKVMIARFFTTTQAKTINDSEKVDSLSDFRCLMERRLTHVPSKHVMSSIITLLWNSGKKLEKSGNLRQSIGYYKLALNELISQNYGDRAKVQRALQNAYINIGEFCEAEKIHELMDPPDKASPLSQLQMLRIHLHAQDEVKAYRCLENIRNSGQENAIRILILAAAECKRCSDLAVRGMLMLLEMLEDIEVTEKNCSDISFSTACLLRYTVQMIVKMAEDDTQEVFGKYLKTLETLIKNGVSFFKRYNLLKTLEPRLKKDSSNREVISVDEVEWFASTSYNIALQCRKRLDGLHVNFAAYSLQFIEMLPMGEFTCPRLLHYLYWKHRASLLYIDTERKMVSPSDEVRLRQTQKDCSSLIDEISKELNNPKLSRDCEKDQLAQITECLVDAFVLSFEIALSARDQPRIRDILKKTVNSPIPQLETLLFESAVSCVDLPTGVLAEILQILIERSIASITTGNHSICLWLRSLLEIGINTKEDSQRNLTDRVLSRLKTTFERTDPNLPALKQELEMLATLIWNQGVRCIIRGEKNVGANWCVKSITFASFANEGLESNLKTLWVSLSSSANIEDHELAAIHD